jgi:hypothetical protein
MPGDDVINVQSAEEIEGAEQIVKIDTVKPYLTARENGISHEDDPFLGHVHADVRVGMTRRVVEFKIMASHFQGHPVGKKDVGDTQFIVRLGRHVCKAGGVLPL